MADKRLIRQHLISINLQTKSVPKTVQELEILVDKFHGEMVYITDADCDAVFLQFIRSSPYFPSVKEILQRAAILKRQRELKQKFIPELPSEEQRAINLKGIQQVRERLNKLKKEGRICRQ